LGHSVADSDAWMCLKRSTGSVGFLQMDLVVLKLGGVVRIRPRTRRKNIDFDLQDMLHNQENACQASSF
jgi:hypothetical protein